MVRITVEAQMQVIVAAALEAEAAVVVAAVGNNATTNRHRVCQ